MGAVQHALGSQQRIWVLLYWALLLVAALPAMDWLARASVPTIIVRKVGTRACTSHQRPLPLQMLALPPSLGL